MQESYAAFWDDADEIRTGRMRIAQANKLCLRERNAEAKRLRQEGRKVVCSALSGQLRQYWGLGEPCGHGQFLGTYLARQTLILRVACQRCECIVGRHSFNSLR